MTPRGFSSPTFRCWWARRQLQRSSWYSELTYWGLWWSLDGRLSSQSHFIWLSRDVVWEWVKWRRSWAWMPLSSCLDWTSSRITLTESWLSTTLRTSENTWWRSRGCWSRRGWGARRRRSNSKAKTCTSWSSWSTSRYWRRMGLRASLSTKTKTNSKWKTIWREGVRRRLLKLKAISGGASTKNSTSIRI